MHAADDDDEDAVMDDASLICRTSTLHVRPTAVS